MLWWTLRQLDSANPERRRRAVARLGRDGGERSIAALAGALSDPDAAVRRAAAMALAAANSTRRNSHSAPLLTGELVRALKDSDPETQEELARALEAIDPDWHKTDHAQSVYADLTVALRGPEPDPSRKLRLLAAAGHVRDSRALPTLFALLRDASAEVREAAAGALGHFDANWRTTRRAPVAIPSLLAGLVDPAWEVREGCARALGRIGNPRAVEPLRHRQETDPSPEVRRAATEALDRISRARGLA